MRRLLVIILVLVVLAGAALFGARWLTRSDLALAAADPGSAERGEAVFIAAGCQTCHTATEPGAPLLAGGRALETPFGIFYAPNITPDPEHGIGGWSDEDFARALRQGVSPGGADYYPAFPYPTYTRMTDQDLVDLKAYIFTMPAVAQPNRPHELGFPYNLRFGLAFWKLLYLEPGPEPADPDLTPELARGRYLARAVSHCGECHTPRNFAGASDDTRYLAGTNSGPSGRRVPNITPDPETGIGNWREIDILDVISTGMDRDGDFVGGAMAEMVRDTTGKMSEEDRRAIVAYIRSVLPVVNAVEE